jgi:hypothetical protein
VGGVSLAATAPRRPRTARRFGCLVLVVVLAASGWVGYAAVRRRLDQWRSSTGCQVGVAGSVVMLDADQAADAATIAAVAMRRGLPERALVIAFATAIQESKLRNLRFGDRDSLGLFQQRPSQGWGTAAQILDPAHATGSFFDRLVAVPRYQEIPVADAAQAVQRSVDGSAYAGHVGQATVLAESLTGRAPATMLCTVRDPSSARQVIAPDGLTARAQAVRAAASHDFAGAVRVTGTGRTLELTVAARGPAGLRAGWTVAQWAVAHAASLDIREVTYAGQSWTVRGFAPHWRPAPPSVADHVQVEVP